MFHGPVTLWIKFKGLVLCFWKKQNRLWYNYWKDACLIMFPFVSRPRNFMNKVERACIMFLKERKTVYDIIIGRTHVWCFHLFHGPVTLWIKFKGLVSCCLWYNYWRDACLIMFPFVSRPRNFMNKVQRACIMFLKETKPSIWYNYWKDACLIMFPFVSRPRNFMNKVQRACTMFLKETKPFMI